MEHGQQNVGTLEENLCESTDSLLLVFSGKTTSGACSPNF